MRVIGVDCAVDENNMGLALGYFDAGYMQVDEVVAGRCEKPRAQTIVDWVGNSPGPLLMALDAPLGWPTEMAALAQHQAGEPLAVAPNQLFRRYTDQDIRERLGKQPLDVGADRIARTAHAALALLGTLQEALGQRIPLAWEAALSGPATIEVYPAATLKAHDLIADGYKRGKPSEVARRHALKAELNSQLAVPDDLVIPDIEVGSDGLDAVVCLLAAQDFLQGKAIPPKGEPALSLAKREGWIWCREALAKIE